MTTLLQIDFPHQGPFGEQMAEALSGLAQSISREPGFLWKIWTENEASQEGGGIYLFEDRASAEAYLAMHSARLKEFGVPAVNAKLFDVNNTLSSITNGPIK